MPNCAFPEGSLFRIPFLVYLNARIQKVWTLYEWFPDRFKKNDPILPLGESEDLMGTLAVSFIRGEMRYELHG